ncbi:hypothetical protein C8Q80DRAFT_956405 [Daedaleopsis nitida]|nr:hypothetical protein C8Q80DRAFT_956405 [Daedaleopsis nitida]
MYHTITLTSSDKIQRFAYALMRAEDELVVDQLPAAYIRKLWLGPTSSLRQNDLGYGSIAWPITLIHQILTRCPSLQALAVICIGQGRWYRLTGVIPKSVTSLCLGPVHGEVDYKHLPCAPNLRSFTSMDTFMLDTEVRDLVLAPTIRTIRRVYSSGDRLTLAFDQLECVARAEALEKFEIVCCGDTSEHAAKLLADVAAGYEYDRERVVLVPWSNVKEGRSDAIAVLYDCWMISDI